MKIRTSSISMWLLALASSLFIFCKKSSINQVNENPGTPITTIIMVRHAEKDSAGGTDPGLSAAGIQRAQRLANSFPGIVPDQFYSTYYNRTKATLAPWATSAGKTIQLYDAAKPADFAMLLKQQPGKTIIVAGHSNTVPPLVNMLIGEMKYQDLQENEYDKIFVITIKGDSTTSIVKTY